MEYRETLKFTPGKSLNDFNPSYTGNFKKKKEAKIALDEGIDKLRDLQDVLYAHNRYGVLIILQGMDASGKDSLIKHALKGVNPQGCQVKSFKAPSSEELDHDYMWRCFKALPERGNIGIFNRSYYEEVLIVRVHPEMLEKQKLPGYSPELHADKAFWEKRMEDINNFEKYMGNNGFLVLKFFLNLSKKEQKQRFLKRINKPSKNWKFTMSDVNERVYWDRYQKAYETSMIKKFNTHENDYYGCSI